MKTLSVFFLLILFFSCNSGINSNKNSSKPFNQISSMEDIQDQEMKCPYCNKVFPLNEGYIDIPMMGCGSLGAWKVLIDKAGTTDSSGNRELIKMITNTVRWGLVFCSDKCCSESNLIHR